ncbi:MAG: ABC transporter ATP-binding protein [Alphaproteobacteria bacterium]
MPTGADGACLIRIAQLDMRFTAKGGAVQALSGVSLDIRAGEFFSIVGPSGCGKSTLLLLIAGLERQSAGTLTINGHAPSARAREAALVFQQDILLEWRTVLANILLPAELRGGVSDDDRTRATTLLESVGLRGFENHYPHELSGGMRQRAALCRALLCETGVLLMDEPFGALDALSRQEHQMMLQRIWMTERKTVLMVTHDIREAILLSDRVAIMSARPGRIKDIVDIDLPRPRPLDIEESPRFNQLVTQIRQQIVGAEPLDARAARGGYA